MKNIFLHLVVFITLSSIAFTQEIWVTPGNIYNTSFTLSSDKSNLAYLNANNSLIILETETGEYTKSFELPVSPKSYILGYSDNNSKLIILFVNWPKQNIVRSIDLNTGSITDLMKFDSLDYDKIIFDNSSNLMYGHTKINSMNIWDLATGCLIAFSDTINQTMTYDFDLSKDEKNLFLVKSDAIYNFDLDRKEYVKKYPGYNFNWDRIAVANRGNYFVQYTTGTSYNIRLYDTSKVDPIETISFSNLNRIFFSNDDKYLYINDIFDFIKYDIIEKTETGRIKSVNSKYFSNLESIDDSTFIYSSYNLLKINFSTCKIDKQLTCNDNFFFIENNDFLITHHDLFYTIYNQSNLDEIKSVSLDGKRSFSFIENSDYISNVDTNGLVKLINIIDEKIIDSMEFHQKVGSLKFSKNLEYCSVNFTDGKKLTDSKMYKWKTKEIIFDQDSTMLLIMTGNGNAFQYIDNKLGEIYLRSTNESLKDKMVSMKSNHTYWDRDSKYIFMLDTNKKLIRFDLNTFEIDNIITVNTKFLQNAIPRVFNDSLFILGFANGEIGIFNYNDNQYHIIYNKIKASVSNIQINSTNDKLLVTYKGFTHVLLDFKLLSNSDDSCIKSISTLKVIPNPAQSRIRIDNLKSNDRLSLINSIGEILVDNLIPLDGTVEIDISSLSQGIYYVRCGNQFGKFLRIK